MRVMAAPVDDTISADSGDAPTFCYVDATVATGFEVVAKEDAEEKLKADVKVKDGQGKITIHLPIQQTKQILDLGGIDNCSVLLTHVKDFGFTDDERENMQRLRQLVGSVDWSHGLKVWRQVFSFEHPIADKPEFPITDFGEPQVALSRPQKLEGSKRYRKQENRKKNKENKRKKLMNDDGTEDEKETQTEAGEDLGSNKVEMPTDKVEIPTDKVEISTDKVEIPTDKVEISTDKVEISTDKVEISADKVQISTDKVEIPADKVEIPTVDVQLEGTEELKSSENLDKLEKGPDNGPRKAAWLPTKPSFRVTCNRTGENHCFHSMTAASNFGGAVNDYFGWNVKMTDFDIEVILNIDDQDVSVHIGLTKESLHRRNINHFGPTTLRPTLAYNMLRLCKIKTGDVVCDPMCGTGSIPIQGALRWPKAHHICGDISRKVMMKAIDNLADQSTLRQQQNKPPLPMDLTFWDVKQLPLRDNSVDVFVTDLPFGIRSGSKLNNWTLYPGVLKEMARVCPPKTGRACLLTQDKKCMIKTLQCLSRYWHRHRTLGVNIGGLAAGVYILQRTLHPYNQTEAAALGRGLQHDKTKTPVEEA